MNCPTCGTELEKMEGARFAVKQGDKIVSTAKAVTSITFYSCKFCKVGLIIYDE